MDNPGIKLMGFKSLESIKPYHNIRESYFIYPEEGNQGASQVCDALIKSLASKNKVAIVKFIPREGANIRFFALVPQRESFDEDYFQTPPGFNLIFLPYADEIRSNEDILQKSSGGNNIEENQPSEEQLNLAKKIIKKMNIEFDSRNFENPTIQKFYATLQTLALNEGEIEEVQDYIQPDDTQLKKVLNGLDEEFNQTFLGKSERQIVRKETKAKKRDESSEKSERSVSNPRRETNKRSKKMTEVEEVDESEVAKSAKKSSNKKLEKSTAKIVKKEDSKYSTSELQTLSDSGDLEKMLVKDLKTICHDNNIRLTSKATKKDILKLIEDFLSNN